MALVWPLALVVFGNIIYHLCSKSIPAALDPFASLTITYLVGAVVAATLYLVTHHGTGLIHEVGKANWAPVVLGVTVAALELGFIFAYRNGWQISTLNIVASAFLTVALILVGAIFFHEEITVKKVIGVLVCLAGVYLVNQ